MDQHDFFIKYGLNESDAEAVAEKFTACYFPAYQTIIQQGDFAESFYFIGSGRVIVLYRDALGKEVIQNIHGPGNFVGEIGLLQGTPRSATVKSLTDCTLYRLEKKDFHQLLENNKGFAALLDKIRIDRLLGLIPAFRSLGQNDLEKIRSITKTIEYSSNELICQEQDKAENLFLIIRGHCNLSLHEQGRTLDAGERCSGEYYGDEAFFKRQNYAHTMATTTETSVLSINCHDLDELIKNDAGLAAKLSFEKGILGNRKFWQWLLPLFYDKKAYQALPVLSMARPKAILYSMLSLCFALILIALVPSVWPQHFPYLHHLKIDTDPENMLPEDDPARVFHVESRRMMDLYDIMAIGVVNTDHEDGIYNVKSLQHIFQLTEFAKSLRWEEDGEMVGVVEEEVMALSTVDNIEQAGSGAISFSWLMRAPPQTSNAALQLKSQAKKLPTLLGTLVAENDQAVAIYLPLTSKEVSFRIYRELQEFVTRFEGGGDRFYIAGLPVAEDAFGVEMFIQMAISAPLAMLAIFFVMYLFFKNITLITAPMIIAMVAVICTMSLLVISGQTIHIMSSMIAIFVMPIAVLDSVHILSEFFDFYPRIRDRRLTMSHVMHELFVPMFYTSVTTALGFMSLALVPIPPIQVFGIFVAIGVILAWVLSISFIPAYILLVDPKRIDAILEKRRQGDQRKPLMIVLLNTLRANILSFSRPIVIIFVVVSIVFLYGISLIQVNDNPVRWFQKDHYLSISDTEMNRHFAGTYIAYLSLTVDDEKAVSNTAKLWSQYLREEAGNDQKLLSLLPTLNAPVQQVQVTDWLDSVENSLELMLDDTNEERALFLEDALEYLDELRDQQQVFKQPSILQYINRLQKHLESIEVVGKTLSISDLVKLVNRELHSGEQSEYRIPDTSGGIAQTLLTYQSSHRPQDIWHYITHDYQRGVIAIMLNKGDNIDMNRVVMAAEDFIQNFPPPQSFSLEWFGLNYINVVWQQKMVTGMMFSIIGSYLAVLLIMTILLRSYVWGLLAMIPLSMTLMVIYGVLGLSGKYYDMPVAVLSALAIGLAVDFAVHFLIRIRNYHSQCNDWQHALELFFGEPAQAFIRNVIVITVGFTPLLLASLVPYNTVGILIASIMLVSGAVSLVIFTALFSVFNKRLFKQRDIRRTSLLDCRSVLFAGGLFIALVIISLQGFIPLTINSLWLYLLIVMFVIIMARVKCRQISNETIN